MRRQKKSEKNFKYWNVFSSSKRQISNIKMKPQKENPFCK